MSTQFGETVEVGIVTNNLDAMRHFYGELLALPLEGRLEFPGGSMERYRVGGNIIKLVNYGDDTPAKGVPGGGYAASSTITCRVGGACHDQRRRSSK